jgi:hypothetical protein
MKRGMRGLVAGGGAGGLAAIALIAAPSIAKGPWAPGFLQDPGLREASGLAPSMVEPGLFWAVNDSGNAPILYAVGADGAARGRVRVRGVANSDWEALGSGPCPPDLPSRACLYIADIGDNGRERRQVRIEIVVEPAPGAKVVVPAMRLRATYEGGPRDAEVLLVHPANGALFIVEKTQREVAGDGAGLFALKPTATEGVVQAKRIGRIAGRTVDRQFAGPFTDGAILPDGSRFVIRDYRRTYLAELDPTAPEITLAPFPSAPVSQGETLAIADRGRSIVFTSEGRFSPTHKAPIVIR